MLKQIKLEYQNVIKINDQKNDTTKVSLVIISKAHLKFINKYSSKILEVGYLKVETVSLNGLLIVANFGFLGGIRFLNSVVSEAYSEPCQTFKMERFAKIVYG